MERREEFDSDEAFWDAYKDSNGNRLCYTHILARLQEERKTRNRTDAADALRFFCGDLGSAAAGKTFLYTKTGVVKVATKDSVIGSRWRELLASSPEVLEQWSKMASS